MDLGEGEHRRPARVEDMVTRPKCNFHGAAKVMKKDQRREESSTYNCRSDRECTDADIADNDMAMVWTPRQEASVKGQDRQLLDAAGSFGRPWIVSYPSSKVWVAPICFLGTEKE